MTTFNLIFKLPDKPGEAQNIKVKCVNFDKNGTTYYQSFNEHSEGLFFISQNMGSHYSPLPDRLKTSDNTANLRVPATRIWPRACPHFLSNTPGRNCWKIMVFAGKYLNPVPKVPPLFQGLRVTICSPHVLLGVRLALSFYSGDYRAFPWCRLRELVAWVTWNCPSYKEVPPCFNSDQMESPTGLLPLSSSTPVSLYETSDFFEFGEVYLYPNILPRQIRSKHS